MDSLKEITEWTVVELKEAVKRTLEELKIPFDKKAELIMLMTVYYDRIIQREAIKHRLMNLGFDISNPKFKMFLDAFFDNPPEPLEDIIKRLKLKRRRNMFRRWSL